MSDDFVPVYSVDEQTHCYINKFSVDKIYPLFSDTGDIHGDAQELPCNLIEQKKRLMGYRIVDNHNKEYLTSSKEITHIFGLREFDEPFDEEVMLKFSENSKSGKRISV